jgi:hypothetical protein
VLNGREEPVDVDYAIERLTAATTAYVYRWDPGRGEALGPSARLDLRLGPRSSQLYYLSRTPDPPPADLGLSGREVRGLPPHS